MNPASHRPWLDARFRRRPDAPSGDPLWTLPRWQCGRLAETLAWAAGRSPWYARRLDPKVVSRLIRDWQRLAEAEDCSPRSLGRLGSARATVAGAATEKFREEISRGLAELPFTAPDDVAADSEAFWAVGQSEVEGLVSVPTSGTSGPVKRIGSTADDLEETVAFFEYGMRFLVAPGVDRVALAMSPSRPGNVGDLLGRALARWSIPFLAHGFVPPEDEERWLTELSDWAPTCLVGVPPQMLALSRHAKARLLGRTLKTLLLSGDVADDRLVAELEKNFNGALVFRHYGLTETGSGGAVECGQRRWPHLRDDLWVEIVDPETGAALRPGRAGEITVTPLTRRGFPLLRYRTGDEGLIVPEPCGCGSVLPRLKVLGRLADRLALPGGRAVRVGDFEAPLLTLPFVRDFGLRLHLGAPDCLAVLVTTTAEIPSGAGRLVAETLWNWLGAEGFSLPLAVEFNPPADPEFSRAAGGKRRLTRSAGPPRSGVFYRQPREEIKG